MKLMKFLVGSGVAVAVAITVAAGWTHAKSAPDHRHTYLGPAISQLAQRVPPPPPGAAVIEADRQVFRTTRALQGSARWIEAVNDVDQSPPALLEDFSCAAGLNLTPEVAPHLTSLLSDAGADAAHISSRAKEKFRRNRPYVLDQGPTCGPTGSLGDFHDYPSGHTARGWTWGLVLAALLPDRRKQLTARAQAYADSRVVCGFHSPTGVGAGRTVAMLTVNSLMRDPSFRADMKQASNELAALKQRAHAPSERQCQSELTLATKPY